MLKTERACMLVPVLLACAMPAAALAQTAYLEQSGIVGEGKTLSISRLPVAAANGKISYWDGTINLAVSSAGVPSVTSTPVFVISQMLKTNHFVAGRYYVKYQNQATQFGTLKYGVGTGGSTVWSLVMDQNPDGVFPEQATWQTGRPAPDVIERLKAAKVENNLDYSYGIVDVGTTYQFDNNGLIAAEQVSNNLFIFSYSYAGTDQMVSDASITLTLCANSSCSNAPQ